VKKLLLAVQPTLENLAPFHLNQQEKAIFSKAKYTGGAKRALSATGSCRMLQR